MDDVSPLLPRKPAHPSMLVLGLAVAALLLSLFLILRAISVHELWQALVAPDPGNPRHIDLRDATLPRLVLSLLCGTALGLAGAIFQQVLQNPMAEPATLGISPAAYLAVSLASIWVPNLVAGEREVVALLGGVLAMLTVLGLAWRARLSPIAVTLAGLIVGLYCSSFNTALILFEDGPRTLSLWGSGSLDVQDWQAVWWLGPQLIVISLAAVSLRRPLNLLHLGEAGALGLGLSLRRTRLIALGLAVALSVAVVSAVGVMSFIGLAAPALARLAGARTLGQRLFWSATLGAALLWLSDELVKASSILMPPIPTGAASALLGAPLLFWLLPRLRSPIHRSISAVSHRRYPHPSVPLGMMLLLTMLAMAASLALGKGIGGWRWSNGEEFQALAYWRLPRLEAAMAAGAMLAVAGSLLQRLTGNPMASPEVLGVSTGASFGVLAFACVAPSMTLPSLLVAASIGAILSLGLILFLGRRSDFAPDQLLLAGVTLSMAFSGLQSAVLTSGNPRLFGILGWLSGSTYLVQKPMALSACLAAAILIGAAALSRRWLDILPLGSVTARGLGVRLDVSRSAIILVASLLTAVATLIVGPFSFVGLMGPHIVRQWGLRRPLWHLIGSGVFGSLLMVIADWLGRVSLFPNQMPAGLIATLVGGLYLIISLARRSA